MVVGVLGNAEDNHTSMVRAELVAIGKLLERAGAPQWAEPELDDGEGADFEAWGCAGLHTVRRLAVRLAASGRLPKKARGGYRLRPRSALDDGSGCSPASPRHVGRRYCRRSPVMRCRHTSPLRTAGRAWRSPV